MSTRDPRDEPAKGDVILVNGRLSGGKRALEGLKDFGYPIGKSTPLQPKSSMCHQSWRPRKERGREQ